MKRGELVLVSFILVIMLIGIVSAFGVGQPCDNFKCYGIVDSSDNLPALEMTKGEVKTVNVNLQNMVGNESVTVKAEIKEGLSIASINQDTYLVPAQTSNIQAPLVIRISSSAVVGDTTKIVVEFKTVTSGAGGMVAIGTGMTISFDVVIIEKVEQASAYDNVWLWVVLIAVIAVIIALATKKKGKNKFK